MVSGELLEHLGFDERQVAAEARVPPMAGACGIAMPREALVAVRSVRAPRLAPSR